jgi:hypothetical protein
VQRRAAAWITDGEEYGCEESEIGGVSFDWITMTDGRKGTGRSERSCPYDVSGCTDQM